ncbi:IS66 family transposase [sulfur-oxidizing endosymbiont of Gigantopelta aegis]|uniref:IS66 family transposase n=1 Tax=sulfur-oxidizing endosymbiont of Gigantopelta aegis TaxID=2794934 RepID=UPI0031B64FA7
MDIIPAKVQILEYFQEKAVFAGTNDTDSRSMKAAVMPKHPLPKSMGSIHLMAHIIISKYADGLPLYRMEGILSRYGGDITRATMANWAIKLAHQFQPLINLMREHQLSGDIIQMDETVLKVLKEPGLSAHSNKYMWVSRGGPPGQPSVLFEYDPSRKKEVPLRLLDGFSGYLQTDGYAGYNAVCAQNNATSVGCWDHTRRKFKDSQTAQPKKKSNQKPTKADVALAHINKLYLIEREIKEASVNEKFKVRQKQSLPLLEKIRTWVDNTLGKVPNDSLTGKALTYIDNQWPKLTVYCEDGRLNISNVLAENAIRPFCVGRKAWLFSDTPKGAHASAVHYSFIETAKANDIEPYAYMVYVLTQLPYADTVEKLEALLPWNFKKSELEKVKNAVR